MPNREYRLRRKSDGWWLTLSFAGGMVKGVYSNTASVPHTDLADIRHAARMAMLALAGVEEEEIVVFENGAEVGTLSLVA